ncbi:hypothetical protein FRC17_005965 [Serendipita sp. 399]|nr:hypothetical protein FRC17_005965 [Serendipita sp. 399]
MFKNVLLASFAVVMSMTIAVMGQCSNGACQVANAIYKECKVSSTSAADFKKCLCTKKFLVNYERCIGGTVCAWDGNPSTLNQPCIDLYCPGTFDGGFDAKAFCEGRLTTSSSAKPITPTRTIRTLTPILTGGPITVRPTRIITLDPPYPTV